MKYTDIKEGVGRITKQNQTVDVGPNEISIQAAKFGNSVDKDGRPANMKKKVKGSKTNVLFNLGMTESVDNLYENVLYFRQMKENLGEIAQATEIYVDMDGVLADFFGEWAKLMQVDHYSKIDDLDINVALQKIRDTDQFWLDLPLLPQAKQLLAVIKQIKGEYNICSTPLADDPNSEPHKRKWIEKNLAFFPPKNVYITHDKPQYATQSDGTPNILIDDFGKNVNAWDAAGGTGFKYKDHKFERTAKDLQQHLNAKVHEAMKEEGETNAFTAKAATQKAKKYDLPIRKDIADLIVKAYPELEDIWTIHDKHGIVGTKLRNGPLVRKLQKQMKADGYTIKTDGKAGDETDKVFNHWLSNVVRYIMHEYLNEPIRENFADGKKKGKSKPGRVKKSGASCNGTITQLRKRAKNASGEKAKMYHWCANMKSGKKK
jgi:5'(3')-deoxyribonucleotidase